LRAKRIEKNKERRRRRRKATVPPAHPSYKT